jgi:hypothetical protein
VVRNGSGREVSGPMGREGVGGALSDPWWRLDLGLALVRVLIRNRKKEGNEEEQFYMYKTASREGNVVVFFL